jgi:hypothetical protein
MRSLIIILLAGLTGCGGLNNPVPDTVNGFRVLKTELICGATVYLTEEARYSLDYFTPVKNPYLPSNGPNLQLTKSFDGYYRYQNGYYQHATCYVLL